MKLNKSFILFIAVLAINFCFTSCGKKESDKKITVAALMRNDSKGTFDQSYLDALIEEAENMNVELVVYTSNYDGAIQMDQLKGLLSQGIRYFVFFPVDTSLTEQLAKLIASCDGAAAFSNIIPSLEALKVSKKIFYASSPETLAGEYQSQILDEYFTRHPDKAPGKVLKILYIDGEYGHQGQIYRRKGLLDGLAAKGYTVNMVREDTANWSYETARQIMDNWLLNDRLLYSKNEFNVVVCQNDEMALGAVSSLFDNGYVDDPRSPTNDVDGDGTVLRVPVVGIDATAKGSQSMTEKKLYATVWQDVKTQAATALELVVACAKDGTAEGLVTKNGIRAATAVSQEPPITDKSILDQCYPVPFVPVTR